MAPGRKRGNACWTCRLRRKRCDLVRPICQNCQNLDIVCHSNEVKPPWMDGGAGQKRMSDQIKLNIKQNIHLRKEKRRLIQGGQGIMTAVAREHSSHLEHVSSVGQFGTDGSGSITTSYVTPSDSTASAVSPVPGSSTNSWPSSDQHLDLRPFPDKIESVLYTTVGNLETPSSTTATFGVATPIKVQFGFIMIYLDHVFPFLFPFYQPPLIETGRQWLLGLLCHNTVSFHVAVSLSAYFFTLIPQSEGQDMHDECKALVWNQLLQQMDSAIQSIRDTIAALNVDGHHLSLLDRVRAMEETMQLLVVETTIRRGVEWTMHLTPALSLFEEIFQSERPDERACTLSIVLATLPTSIPTSTPHHKSLPNTADQSALIFFASLLLFVDIIGSTSLETPPALHQYHPSLLSHRSKDNCSIRLESVIGCQNWAFVAIGKISALCAWKRKAKESGNFSVIDLVRFAEPISQALEDGLTRLDACTDEVPQKITIADRLNGYYTRHDKSVNHTRTANITRIWSYAAKIYLAVCLSGWQPHSVDIHTSVKQVLILLQAIESPAQLQSLTWPICVAGCLALPSQEDEFRHIIRTVDRLGEFGNILEALRIMEVVWRSREDVNCNNWDIAACLNALGSPVLLI